MAINQERLVGDSKWSEPAPAFVRVPVPGGWLAPFARPEATPATGILARLRVDDETAKRPAPPLLPWVTMTQQAHNSFLRVCEKDRTLVLYDLWRNAERERLGAAFAAAWGQNYSALVQTSVDDWEKDRGATWDAS